METEIMDDRRVIAEGCDERDRALGNLVLGDSLCPGTRSCPGKPCGWHLQGIELVEWLGLEVRWICARMFGYCQEPGFVGDHILCGVTVCFRDFIRYRKKLGK